MKQEKYFIHTPQILCEVSLDVSEYNQCIGNTKNCLRLSLENIALCLET